VIEDTMFFPRLRRQAKWVFLFLALVFGIGFVGFGVGAGGIGLGNVLEGVAQNGVPSVSEAEKRVSENPRDPAAFRDLATAHQAENNTAEAIEALENLVLLRPKNVDALRELAGLYLTQASQAQQRANEANTRAAYIAPGASVASTILIDGKPLDPDAISSAVNTRLNEAVSAALGEAQQAASNAVTTYKKIAAAQPNDPAVQLELAQAAESAGDTASAIAAFKEFLRLAPEDPTAPEVRRLLKQLQGSTTG
jgi:regulator of sirC expression with transglutaminase-like and TPR domain